MKSFYFYYLQKYVFKDTSSYGNGTYETNQRPTNLSVRPTRSKVLVPSWGSTLSVSLHE